MAKKKTAYEKKLDYNNAYNRENYRSFSVRYSITKEKKIIAWLEKQPSVKAYLTELITKDMDATKERRKAARATKKTTE